MKDFLKACWSRGRGPSPEGVEPTPTAPRSSSKKRARSSPEKKDPVEEGETTAPVDAELSDDDDSSSSSTTTAEDDPTPPKQPRTEPTPMSKRTGYAMYLSSQARRANFDVLPMRRTDDRTYQFVLDGMDALLAFFGENDPDAVYGSELDVFRMLDAHFYKHHVILDTEDSEEDTPTPGFFDVNPPARVLTIVHLPGMYPRTVLYQASPPDYHAVVEVVAGTAEAKRAIEAWRDGDMRALLGMRTRGDVSAQWHYNHLRLGQGDEWRLQDMYSRRVADMDNLPILIVLRGAATSQYMMEGVRAVREIAGQASRADYIPVTVVLCLEQEPVGYGVSLVQHELDRRAKRWARVTVPTARELRMRYCIWLHRLGVSLFHVKPEVKGTTPHPAKQPISIRTNPHAEVYGYYTVWHALYSLRETIIRAAQGYGWETLEGWLCAVLVRARDMGFNRSSITPTRIWDALSRTMLTRGSSTLDRSWQLLGAPPEAELPVNRAFLPVEPVEDETKEVPVAPLPGWLLAEAPREVGDTVVATAVAAAPASSPLQPGVNPFA